MLSAPLMLLAVDAAAFINRTDPTAQDILL